MFRLLIMVLSPLCLTAGETVFCIHGFLRSPSSMEGMARGATREGYHVENWGYPSREATIEQHAEALVRDLSERAEQYPGHPIHFITHSLGGIITLAALNHPDCPEEAKMGRAVLLAPPVKGSRFGRCLGKLPLFPRFLGPFAGAQLLKSPSFEHFGQFPPTMKVLIISGTFGFNPMAKGMNDGKVGVKESCLPGEHEHRTHFSGHSWIMYNDTVIYNACSFISSK